MKRFLFVILAVMLLTGIAVSQAQAGIMTSPDARIKSSVWVGITSNGATPTSGSAITSANRIVGYSVTGSSNPAAGLYDASGLSTALDATLFDEAAAASNSESRVWYPAPKALVTGLSVINNASTTVTTVYYE
jgi:hypothetical protein